MKILKNNTQALVIRDLKLLGTFKNKFYNSLTKHEKKNIPLNDIQLGEMKRLMEISKTRIAKGWQAE